MPEVLLKPDSNSVVYDIRTDSALLSEIREASLSSGPFGLAFDDGIVGSGKWWSAVDSGRVPLAVFSGTIVRIDGGPMGDSSILRIANKEQTKSWVAWNGFRQSLVGTAVTVVYARVKPKRPPREGFMVDLVLQVQATDASVVDAGVEIGQSG
jgi:hypothetical protein